MRTISFAIALSLALGCEQQEIRPEYQNIEMVFALTHSNVSEFDGKINIPIIVEDEDGFTKVTINPVPAWPVGNGFLGFDKFFYNAPRETNPIIRIQSEGCDEPVVDGRACGWSVNEGSCVGDGFGCFGSLASSDPAGHGASSSPLVFYLAGDASLLPNDHGSRVALHARFGEGPLNQIGCSGWFSDGTSSGLGSEPGCEPIIDRDCVLNVVPSRIVVERGGVGAVTVETSMTGEEPFPPLRLRTSETPIGTSFSLQPNPVVPPGSSVLTIQTSESTPEGTSLIIVEGQAEGENGLSIFCEAQFTLEVKEIDMCGCPE